MTNRVTFNNQPTIIIDQEPLDRSIVPGAPVGEVDLLARGVACPCSTPNARDETVGLLMADITGGHTKGTSVKPMGIVVGQAVMNAGATVAAFSSAAQSTWEGDPFQYRAWALGGLAAASLTSVASALTDTSGLARKLMFKSTCPALLGCWAAGALQNGLDTLPGTTGADHEKAVFQIAASAAMLAIAFGFQLTGIAHTAKKAQARMGNVPGIPGNGPQAALAYGCMAAGLAALGTTLGLVARQHHDEPGRVASFSLAALATVPALMALMVATRSA